jgi:hypothetical protein
MSTKASLSSWQRPKRPSKTFQHPVNQETTSNEVTTIVFENNNILKSFQVAYVSIEAKSGHFDTSLYKVELGIQIDSNRIIV